MTSFPSLITAPLPPANGSSIGESLHRPAFQGMPWKAGHHENWGIFNRRFWGVYVRHSQSLHRVRDQLVGERTSLTNQIRSLLLERGHIVPQGRAKLAGRLAELLGDETSDLSPRIRALIQDMRDRWLELNHRIAAFDGEFAAQARDDQHARRLLTIPGIGALNATALVAAVGDARTFARGRDLAAWLGLVPRQATTGGKPRLIGITKRGSKYLRKTLIRGARAALPTLRKADTRLGAWLRALLARAHVNTAVVDSVTS